MVPIGGDHERAGTSCGPAPRRARSATRCDRGVAGRVYQDLKKEFGLDHFEGRRFRGWHHHVSCAIACFAFLAASEQGVSPPGTAVWQAPTTQSASRPERHFHDSLVTIRLAFACAIVHWLPRSRSATPRGMVTPGSAVPPGNTVGLTEASSFARHLIVDAMQPASRSPQGVPRFTGRRRRFHGDWTHVIRLRTDVR